MKKKTPYTLGIIGDPIAHSLSPAMQNAALKRAQLDGSYRAFAVAPSKLATFLKKNVPGLKLSGLNVTIPHKETVLKRCRKLSKSARAIGAVNTLRVASRGLEGHNTDAEGYLRSLTQDAKFRPRGKTALILGAGGAARAVVYALAQAGAKHLGVSNRTPGRARALIRDFRKKFPRTAFSVVDQDRKSLAPFLAGTDLLVNTTSIGLKGTSWKDMPLEDLPRTALVSDLVYRPLETDLLKSARKRGLRIHDGLGMLLHQGALAFTLWTGKKPDLKTMRRALLDALGEKA